jgi:hypothetical protein
MPSLKAAGCKNAYARILQAFTNVQTFKRCTGFAQNVGGIVVKAIVLMVAGMLVGVSGMSDDIPHLTGVCDFISSFNKSTEHCTAEARLCLPPSVCEPVQGPIKVCTSQLEVSCGKGFQAYSGGLVSYSDAEHFVLQGITSVENPYPPSIFFIQPFLTPLPGSKEEFLASLNIWNMELTGSCVIEQPLSDL